MAETFSAEWTSAFITAPRGNQYGYGAQKRGYPFTYTQVLVGTAADTIVLSLPLPKQSRLSMFESFIRWSTFTSGATLSVGWRAYKDMDGVVQAASAAGLLSAVSLTVDGCWSHGLLDVPTPAVSLPVVFDFKDFNNRDDVVLYATIGSQAPGIGAKLSGMFCVYVP